MTEENVFGVLALILAVLLLLDDEVESQFYSGRVQLLHLFAAMLALHELYRWLYPAAN